MTTLPITYEAAIEGEALTFARERITHFQSGDFCNLGCPVTHPDAGRRLLRRILQHWALSSAESMLQLTELATAGWDEADIAARGLIQEFHNRGEAVPAYLATYNDRLLSGFVPIRPRGQKKATNFLLDFFLVYLIVELTEKFGLKPRRNQLGKKRRASSCSIIANAAAQTGLHRGSEGAIQKIFDRLEPIVHRIDLPRIVRN
jgi:hypothetical protein